MSEEAEKIVRELAEWFPGDREFGDQCMFCYSWLPLKPINKTITELEYHDNDCLWLRANKLVEEIAR